MSYDLWSRLRYVLSPQFDIYEKVAEIVGGYVVDIGCGTGFGTHLFTRKADRVVGYELDEKALSFATKTFSNGNLSFVRVDVTDFLGPEVDESVATVPTAIKAGPFDFVVMIDVIEHIYNDRRAIESCRRILKPSGTFICSTPNRLSRYRKSEYHVREYSPEELKQLLGSVFKSVAIVDYRLIPIESDYDNPIIGICH